MATHREIEISRLAAMASIDRLFRIISPTHVGDFEAEMKNTIDKIAAEAHLVVNPDYFG